jgi:FkbM family methyltransferase
MALDPMIPGRVARAWRRWRRGLFSPPRGPGPHYDHELVEVMRRVLRPDSACVDGGAHLGDLLEPVLELAPRGRHHAFEPLPRLVARLRRCFPEVVVHEAALADRAGRSSFVHVTNAAGYSGLRPRAYDRKRPRLRTIEVETTTLDAALGDEPRLDFLKLDLEGGEYGALRGATTVLTRWRPLVVFEAGPKSSGAYGIGPDDFHALLVDELGYRISTMRRWLGGDAPHTAASFRTAWETGEDYFFLAEPGAAPTR